MKSLLAYLVRNTHRLLIGVVTFVVSGIAFTSFANAQSCQALWVERNSYYKEAGYCFKTPRAIAYFGNAGCIYDSDARVPLSRRIRARVAEIVRIELRLGCATD